MNMFTNPAMRACLGILAAASLAACATPEYGGGHGGNQAGGQMMGGAHSGGMMGGGASGGMMGGGATGGGTAGTSPSSGGMMMGGSTTSGGGQAGTAGASTPANREAMCSVYRSLQNAPTQQQRQAIMEQQMRGMSAEDREERMEKMREQCMH